MVCSPAQLAANRRNASKSTGPRSEAGKAVSRCNALKHGLTGAGVAVPDEDQAAIAGRIEAFTADLKPRDTVARFLVERVALLSVRLERSARHEAAEITRGMLGAVEAEAEALAEEVDRLFASTADELVPALRKLRRTPEGIDRLLEAWGGLKAALAANRWTKPETDLTDRLLGHKAPIVGFSRVASLAAATGGYFGLLAPGDWPDLEPVDRRRAAGDELAAIIDAEVAQLAADRDALDHAGIARSRATAPARALFDTSRQAILARKYEAAAEREFHRSLKLIEHLGTIAEAEGPTADLDATPPLGEESGESASFFRAPEAEDRPPVPGEQARRDSPDCLRRPARQKLGRGTEAGSTRRARMEKC